MNDPCWKNEGCPTCNELIQRANADENALLDRNDALKGQVKHLRKNCRRALEELDMLQKKLDKAEVKLKGILVVYKHDLVNEDRISISI